MEGLEGLEELGKEKTAEAVWLSNHLATNQMEQHNWPEKGAAQSVK